MNQTADRYAKALFELTQEQNKLEAVEDTMNEIRDLINRSKDFRLFLSNPILSYDERCVVLKAMFEGKIPELAFKFLLFITYKKRLSFLINITESFDQLYLSSTHQLRALVTTALPIGENDKVLFNQRLCDKFKHHMLTRWDTNPSLIGGFRIFLQGQIYDYSFKSQLNRFYQQANKPA